MIPDECMHNTDLPNSDLSFIPARQKCMLLYKVINCVHTISMFAIVGIFYPHIFIVKQWLFSYCYLGDHVMT